MLTLLLMVFLQLLPLPWLWLLSRVVLVFELVYGFEDILLPTNGAIAALVLPMFSSLCTIASHLN